MENASPRVRVWPAAIVAAAIFFVAGFSFSGLTGPGHDESAHAVVAARWVLPSVRPNDASWLPWMQSSYMGALKSWFFVPAFRLLGVGVGSMRFTTLAFGAFAVAGLVLLAGTLYGSAAALAAGALAATDPSLILGATHDTGPAALAIALKLWGLFLCARWRAGGSRLALAGAGLLFGLGVWDKSHFLWFVIAFVLMIPWAGGRRPTRGDAGVLGAGFALGAAPWLWFNGAHPGATFLDPAHQGWSLREHLGALGHWVAVRLRIWAESAAGTDALGAVTAAKRRFFDGPLILSGIAQAGAALLLAAAAYAGGRRASLRGAAWWLALLALVVGAAALSPLPVKGHHLYAAYGFGLLILCSLLPERGARPLIFGLLAVQCAALASARADLVRTGGSPFFYRGVAELSSWLESNRGDAAVYAMPRLAGPLLIESAGRVDAREIEAGDPATESGRYAYLRRPGTLIVRRVAPFAYEDEDPETVTKAAAVLGAKLDRVRAVDYSDGRTWAVIERVLPSGATGDAVTAAEHLERGNALYFAHDLKGAAREFEAAAKGDATDPSSRLSLGTVLLESGDAAGAIRALDEAVVLARKRGGQVLKDALDARARAR